MPVSLLDFFILPVLRCFCGAVLFRSLCPSPNSSYPFWLLALTFRSSRPASGGRLTLAVSTTENQFISPMLIQTAFNFSSVVQRLVCRFSGLRLSALRKFQAFLASGARLSSATCYLSCSAAPLPWPSAFSWAAHVFTAGRPFLAFGSNSAVKRTRILRSAYLVC